MWLIWSHAWGLRKEVWSLLEFKASGMNVGAFLLAVGQAAHQCGCKAICCMGWALGALVGPRQWAHVVLKTCVGKGGKHPYGKWSAREGSFVMIWQQAFPCPETAGFRGCWHCVQMCWGFWYEGLLFCRRGPEPLVSKWYSLGFSVLFALEKTM